MFSSVCVLIFCLNCLLSGLSNSFLFNCNVLFVSLNFVLLIILLVLVKLLRNLICDGVCRWILLIE